MLSAILFISLLAPSTSPSPDLIRQAVELSQKGDYEASEKIFQKFIGKPPIRAKADSSPKPMRATAGSSVPAALPSMQGQESVYNFYRLVNAFKLNKKAEVAKLSDEIIYGFGVTYPPRYIDLAQIMKVEAEAWKHDADNLDDIAREMDKATDRLKNNKGGPETQKIQKDVLARLDKMIKDAEDKQKAAQEAAEKAEAEANKKDGDGPGGISPQPAQDTVKGQEQGLGEVDKKRIREVAEVWGKLPEKERAQAMRGLLRKLPAKDRQVIEAYLKEIQKRSGK